MSDQAENVNQFREITNTSEELARHVLEASNWNLEIALSTYLEGTEAGIDEDEIVNIEPFRGDPITSTEEPVASSPTQATEPKKMSEDDKSKPKRAPRSNIATLATLNAETSDDDEEQGQAFYAGGSERSGQQVLGPPRKNPIKDYVTSLFQAAQSGGAGASGGPEHQHAGSSSGGSGGSLFAGSGFRLGQTDDDHVVIPGASGGQSSQQQSEQVILKLWRQGFSINEGDLRPYEDPANREFFESILKGEIPAELRKQNKNMVHMDIEDHRGEDFKKPTKRFTAFGGEGHTLGSPVPNVIESATAVSVDDLKVNEERAQNEVGLNDAEPVTMIQIRLADGSRLTGRFNHTHTVDSVRQFIVTARPNYAAQNFAILSSFPPKELTDGDKTLKDSGLLNATIMQRLK